MRLAHGQFFGHHQARRQVGELVLAEMQPTVPEHEVQTHTHDDAHLLLLLGGDYVSSAQGMPDVCRSATLVLNPPGTQHRDRFRGLAGRFFTLSWTQERWRQACQQRQLPERALRLGASAQAQAATLLSELRRWDDASPLAVQTVFELLLDEAGIDARVEHPSGPAWLSRVRERLADEATTSPDIAELARVCDVHPVYLARAFRRRYGCSPAEYLRRCRLERALHMLQRADSSLTAIAAACGYADHSHFTHAFRRRYGCTPSTFRARSGAYLPA